MGGAAARIGCSGWQYAHWRGVVYPSALPPRRWLEHYATLFDTVEINNSFYRLPEAETFAEWRRRTPPGFVFAVKASRFLTHMKKLKDPAEPLERLLSRAAALGDGLGPILYQLPPRWGVDLQRLEQFLRALPPRVKHVIEFRDSSWYVTEVFALLERHRVALCLHDMAGSATGPRSIGPFVYVRFHGTAGPYGGGYPPDRLGEWAEWLSMARTRGTDVYVYFNNDVGGHAPRDALTLRHLMGV